MPMLTRGWIGFGRRICRWRSRRGRRLCSRGGWFEDVDLQVCEADRPRTVDVYSGFHRIFCQIKKPFLLLILLLILQPRQETDHLRLYNHSRLVGSNLHAQSLSHRTPPLSITNIYGNDLISTFIFISRISIIPPVNHRTVTRINALAAA